MGDLRRSLFAGLAAIACATVAGAGSQSSSNVKAELTTFFNQMAAALNDIGTAQAVAAFYEEDMNIIGDGEKHLYRDLRSFMPHMQGYLENRACRLTVIGDPRQSGDLAVAWVQDHCDQYHEHPAEDYRILYVVRKGPKGWRVTMEMFGTGTF